LRVSNCANEALWGGLGLGGTYAWADDRYALYGEALAKSSFEDFGDSYAVSGTVGFRVKW
jgi:fibronectin-binding autotransporter adhesin